MKERLIDLIIAVAVLIAGIVLIVVGERDLGSIAVTTALGYIAGSFREQPGGLDEMARLGLADVEYSYDAEGEDQ